MRRWKTNAAIFIAAVLLASFAALFAFHPPFLGGEGGMVPITGSTPSFLANASRLAPADPNKVVDVVIGLKLRVSDKVVEDLIDQQSDPQSPWFRHFLTPDQFTQQYAQTQADVDALVAYLQTSGLTVVNVPANRLMIHVTGTVAQVEKAFNVKINDYMFAGVTGYSNTQDPSVPARFQNMVGYINLNWLIVARSHTALPHSAAADANQADNTPLGMSPQALATAYDFPNNNNKYAGRSNFTGKGVTVAVATADNYRLVDVQYFWAFYGIQRTGTLKDVFVDNSPSSKLSDEAALDIEQVGANAPGADILVYLIRNPEFASFTELWDRIVIDNKASIVTTSWGFCEIEKPKGAMETEHRIKLAGNAQGITFVAAGGDDGAYDCGDGTTRITPDAPASDPYITSVGGTTLTLDATGRRASETAWIQAGGAPSTVYPRPSWQFGPGVPSNQMRNTSDVSFNADPHTSASAFSQGIWLSPGGTSFGAPDLASLLADCEEAANSRLGAVNPLLYRMGRSADYHSIFYDVVSGANGNHMGPGFSAGPGWDYPTGWGTPNGRWFLYFIVNEQSRSTNPSGYPLAGSN